MKVIGITGGVGAGKSTILRYVLDNYNALVLIADEIAHTLMEPGEICYNRLLEEFGEEIIGEDGYIDRALMAAIIFNQEEARLKVNSIVHPAVKEYIKHAIQTARDEGKFEIVLVEAALLLDDKYEDICDEIWYIYSSKESRRKRLKSQRGYSDEKIEGIFKSQMSDEDFRAKCDVTIDNDLELTKTYQTIDEVLKIKGDIKQ